MRFTGSLAAVEALCVLAALLPSAVAVPSTAPVVTDKSGRSYRGFKPVSSVQAFLGIPYAQPPVGPLRWKPPQPLPPPPYGDTVQDASKFGNSCYEVQFFPRDSPLRGFSKAITAQTAPSEDCLTLNVWVPETKGKKKLLPVLLYVYAGAFWEGSSSYPRKHSQPGFRVSRDSKIL